MIQSLHIQNFGPLRDVDWVKLSNINLIIGANSSGKTFLLKALYAAIRTLEDYKRGDDKRSTSEILQHKLFWTFQAEKIGDLVTKGQDEPLTFKMSLEGKEFIYSFGKDTAKQISTIENHTDIRENNSIFLPAKEILSIQHIILKSREMDKVFGFDDTYFDLARAISLSPRKGKNYNEFSQSRTILEKLIDGRIEFVDSSKKWIFKKGNAKYTIGTTAEGIKKIAILDTLLGNRYLDDKSVIFIDEPEAALHPAAIETFIEIIQTLSERGLQIIIASHSYFVIKKLYLIAMEKNISVPVLSFDNEEWKEYDLINGMPDNSIINASVDLYMKEVNLQL
jgi:AAA15 family ATPase/GTPase